MFVINENDREYRFGNSGPKYLMKGPRMNFALVQFMPGQDFRAHYHNIREKLTSLWMAWYIPSQPVT